MVQDLERVTFAQIVQDTPELEDVQWIYPDKPKANLWKPTNLSQSYGKRANNPYAKRVCGTKGSLSKSVPQWPNPTPPAGLG